MDVQSLLNLTEKTLDEVLPKADERPAALSEAMRYAVGTGGKRIRPLICLASAVAVGGSPEDARYPAAAIELLHNYTLVHDDLPSMDNDTERRGKPSVWAKFGEANAILAGDGLLTKAGLLLMRQNGFDGAKRAIFEGAYAMVSGQSDDLNLTGRDAETLERIHLRKTGALFRAACVAGAYCSDPEKAEEMRRFGDTLGLLFQMTDDLLDEEKDAAEQKLKYVTNYCREKTAAFIDDAAQSALALLSPYRGEAADELRSLVDALRSRTN